MYRLFVIASAVLCVTGTSKADFLAIEHTTIINVETGAAWGDQTVIVTGNRITAVGSSASVSAPNGAVRIDGSGKFLIPGIWDTHVHALFNGINRTLPFLVANGITAVRDMASSFENVLEARRDGSFIKPRLVLSGPALDGVPPNIPGVPPGVLLVIETPAQGREIVNKLAAARVDLVKVRNGLSRETYFAIAEEAKRWRLPFEGHLPPEVNIVEASDTGQRTIEHLPGLEALCAADVRELRPPPKGASDVKPIQLNRVRCEETARHLVKNGTWLTPTIGAPGQGEPRLREFNRTITLIAAQAGVKLLAGTDWPGVNMSNGSRSVHTELQGLVEAGLTPLEALKTATVNPALLFNLSTQLGSIAEGKLADMVLLEANPLADITNTTRISIVVADGKLIDRAMRKTLLDQEEMAKRAAKR